MGLLFPILFLTCMSKDLTEGINEAFIPYLDRISVDEFDYKGESYSGVVYLYAVSYNDSSYILLIPMQCVMSKMDLSKSFVYKNKTVICKGNQEVLSLIIDEGKMDTKKCSDSIKYCEDIDFLMDIYDPKSIALLITEKSDIKQVDLSTRTVINMITGEELPPPPDSYEEADLKSKK